MNSIDDFNKANKQYHDLYVMHKKRKRCPSSQNGSSHYPGFYEITHKPQKYIFGEWHCKLVGKNISLYHDKMSFCNYHIIFWNVESDRPSVSLPINNDEIFYHQMSKALRDILPEDTSWLMSNLTKICIHLPVDAVKLNKVLS